MNVTLYVAPCYYFALYLPLFSDSRGSCRGLSSKECLKYVFRAAGSMEFAIVFILPMVSLYLISAFGSQQSHPKIMHSRSSLALQNYTTPSLTYPFITTQEPLQQITVIRTQIPLLRLLKLRQPQIRPRLIPTPILQQHARRISAAGRGAQTREADADGIPLLVPGRVLGQERVRGDNTANVAEADLPGRPDGAAVVAAEVEVEPADDDGQGGVGAHGDEEEGGVFEVRPRVDGEEDGEAGDGHGDGEKGEEEAVLELVGEVGDDEGEDEGTGPGGDAVELSADLRVAVCFDDAGGEEGVAVCHVWS